MRAIKHAQKKISHDPFSQASRTLALLVLTLESKESFSLDRLYDLSLDDFELALEIIKEWRLDRYYAGKSKLYDLSVQVQTVGSLAPAVRE